MKERLTLQLRWFARHLWRTLQVAARCAVIFFFLYGLVAFFNGYRFTNWELLAAFSLLAPINFFFRFTEVTKPLMPARYDPEEERKETEKQIPSPDE